MEKESSITEGRNKWLGGSDMAKVFATKNQLTQLAYDKAFDVKHNFSSKYTDYGNLMEPLIREVMNEVYASEFEELFDVRNETLKIRGNMDGYSEELELVLEIKTSLPTKTFEDCIQLYKFQLLTYSYLKGFCTVVLAVLINDNFKDYIDEDSDLQYDEFTYDDLLKLCGLKNTKAFEDQIMKFWEEVEKQKEIGEVPISDKTLDGLFEEYYEFNADKVYAETQCQIIKEEITKRMKKIDVTKYSNDYGKVIIKEPYTKAKFNKKLLCDVMGLDFVKQYSTIEEVKESTVVSLKKEVV